MRGGSPILALVVDGVRFVMKAVVETFLGGGTELWLDVQLVHRAKVLHQ